MSGPTANAGVQVTFNTAGVEQVNRSIASVGEAGTNMGYKMQRAGVSIAFAVQSLFDGNEDGVHRALKAVAQLGFAFGPLEGAIALALSLAGRQVVDFFQKARKEAEETKKKFDETFRGLAHGENLIATAKDANRLRTGDPLANTGDEKGLGAEPFAKVLAAGGVQGVNAQIATLTATVKKLNDNPPAVDWNKPEIWKNYAASVATASEQLLTLQELVAPAAAALAKLDTLSHQQAQTESEREGYAYRTAQDAAAAKRAAELQKIGFDKEEAVAKDHLETADNAVNQSFVKRLDAARAYATEELRINDERVAAIRATSQQGATFDADWTVHLATELAKREQLIRDAAARETNIFKTAEDKDLANLLTSDRGFTKAFSERMTAQAVAQGVVRAGRVAQDDAWWKWIQDLDQRGASLDEKRLERARQNSRELVDITTTAFETILQKGGGLKSFTDSALEQLGQFFVKTGEGWVASAVAMSLFGGPGGLAAGLALIAIGAGMSAAGSHNTGGGGGGGFTPQPVGQHYYGSITPASAYSSTASNGAAKLMPVRPITFSPTIIGTNDPRAQRELGEMFDNLKARKTGR